MIRPKGLRTQAYFSARPQLRVGSNADSLQLRLNGKDWRAPLSVDAATYGPRILLGVEEVQTAPSWHRRQRFGTRYRFRQWSDGVAERNRSFAVPVRGDSLDAEVEVEHHLGLALWPTQGGGAVTADPPSDDGYYPEGTVVTLTAEPAEGQDLVGWLGDATGTGTASVRMDGPRVVEAWCTRARLLQPGTPGLVAGESGQRGFRFSAKGAAKLVLEYLPQPGSAAADLYVRSIGGPNERFAPYWEYLVTGKGWNPIQHREAADFVAEEATGPRRI